MLRLTLRQSLCCPDLSTYDCECTSRWEGHGCVEESIVPTFCCGVAGRKHHCHRVAVSHVIVDSESRILQSRSLCRCAKGGLCRMFGHAFEAAAMPLVADLFPIPIHCLCISFECCGTCCRSCGFVPNFEVCINTQELLIMHSVLDMPSLYLRGPCLDT